MKLNLAHLRQPSVSGASVDFAVFDARSASGSDADNLEVLSRLTARARASGLKIDQAALAYTESGRPKFYGTKTLVEFLSHNGVPVWTHQIDD